MVLHEFGEGLVALTELVFETLEDQLGFAYRKGAGRFGEGRRSVLKQFLLPAVEQCGVDLVLIAERRDRHALQQVLAEDGDFLLSGEMTAVGFGAWGLFHDGFLRCRILYQPAPVFPISSEALQKSRSKNAQNDEKVQSNATEFPVDQDNSVWVEGIKPHDTDAGEFVALKLVKADGTPVERATDKVKIVVARSVIAVFADGPDTSNKLALLNYLKPLCKDNRPQPRMIRESGQSVWYSIEVFGTTGNAGEKLLQMALATEGSYVVSEGHSNFGLGPAFNTGLTSLSAFMNTAPDQVPIKWRYLREDQGHPNLGKR